MRDPEVRGTEVPRSPADHPRLLRRRVFPALVAIRVVAVRRGRPLPDIADHVEQAVSVGGKRTDGRALLPCVAAANPPAVRPVGRIVVAPWIDRVRAATPSSVFPFSLRGQPRTQEPAERHAVEPGHPDHRVVAGAPFRLPRSYLV